jgi:hypothetical protein
MSAESLASRFRVLLGVSSLLALASCQAQTPAAPAKPNAAPAPTAPFTDFRYEAPGNTRKITVADLPQPYATPTAGNGPKIVPRPPNVWPKALPGFKVDLYAEDAVTRAAAPHRTATYSRPLRRPVRRVAARRR